MRLFAMLCAGLLLAGCSNTTAAPEKLTVTKKTIASKTPGLDVDVSYPATGIKTIDIPLAAFAKDRSEDMSANDDLDGPTFDTYMDYTVERNDAEMFSVSLHTSTYAGQNHGQPDATSIHFLRPDGWRVYLDELVDGQRGLDKISKIAIRQLKKKLLGSESEIDDPLDLRIGSDTNIRSGAAPFVENFRNFVWQSDKLIITFHYGQLGLRYGDEWPTVEIPLSELKDVIRENTRAPVASFSCDAAKSASQNAICGDVQLARADRIVAAEYALLILNRLNYGTVSEWDRDDAVRLRVEQQDFLAKRDRCGAELVCLKRVYGAQIALLNTGYDKTVWRDWLVMNDIPPP